jgi:BirA family biotin operon repressor/biotin-[acetyl-CoA-carboxylase] ligase
MLVDETVREGDWLIAMSQSEGRGRQGRQWDMREGNFAGSTLVLLRPGDPPPQTLSLVAGLALIEAAEAAAPGRSLMLKWPNDLLLDGGKLAGVLLERADEKVAVGIGINLATAPAIEGRVTASLERAVEAKAFAPLLAASFGRWLEQWRGISAAEIADAWLERAHPIGTALKVHVDATTVASGRFEGLGSDGALLLRTDHGAIETIRAGDVEL